MGLSSSSERRRRDDYHQYPPPAPPRSPSAAAAAAAPPPNYGYTGNAPYNPYPPPLNPYHSYSQQPTTVYSDAVRFFDQLTGRRRYAPHYAAPPGSGWSTGPAYPSRFTSASAIAGPPPAPPPPFVEHQQAKTVKNDVNVRKDTIRLEPDELNPDQQLVSFTYDALVDGSVTIYYFAKEGTDCSFIPIYEDMPSHVKVPFQKGSGQKFRQPSGHGIDLGFFELDDLLKPLNGDVYPLVIHTEACSQPHSVDEQVGQSAGNANAQITQAIIDKHGDSYQPKVVKQILWVDGERYELQEIYGLANSAEADMGVDGDLGKECVICMTEPSDTAVLPCRHLCMCSDCAKVLRMQSNKCPICRQPVESLMEIKVNSAGK